MGLFDKMSWHVIIINMFLTLYIQDHNHGSWLICDKAAIKFRLDFAIARGEDDSLKYLFKFLEQHHWPWRKLQGVALIVEDASLTQVKVFTTMINTIAWQYQLPTAADFYSATKLNKILEKIYTKLKKQKKFKQITVKYKQKADITISHRHPSYKIVK